MKIATYGYRFIVEPILREMGVPCSRLVACRFWGAYRDRVKGKVAILGLSSRREKEGKLIGVSDSADDAPLLECCDFPFLIQWPEAKSRAPFLEVYLPFLYLTKVKWPGKGYISRKILWDDLPLYLLVYGLAASDPIWTSLVVVLLVTFFWCIYERGYNENDEVGERKEKEPKLSEAYHQRICRVPEGSAWAWALALGAGGVWIQLGHQGEFFDHGIWVLWVLWGRLMLIWLGVLLGCRVFFLIFNHSRKSVRPVLYPILQTFRFVGLAALLPVSLVGGLALFAQVAARSLNYLIYRQSGGKDWPELPEQIVRFGIFTILFSVLVVCSEGRGISLVAVLTSLWFLLRASKQIARILQPLIRSKRARPALEELEANQRGAE